MWITDTSGFGTGFETFEAYYPHHRSRMDGTRFRDRLRWDLDAVRSVEDDGATEVARRLDRWFGEVQRRPFFWFVNLTECHSPYLPPRPYNDLKMLERLRAGEEARRHLTLLEIWKVCLGAAAVPVDALIRMRHLYSRSIRYMDDWLARVLQLLEERHVLEDTVVIVTSDHGENFGESNLIGHSFSLDDRLIRVPFISSHPGLLNAVGAQSLAAVPSALAELAGIQDHPYDGDAPIGGVAVAELERLVDPLGARADEVRELFQLDDIGFRRLTTSAWCATDGRYKLLRDDDGEVLYDLGSDPLELAPIAVDGALSADLSEVVASLRRAGERTLERSLTSFADIATHAPSSLSDSHVSPEELAAIEAQMHRLGYL